MRELLAGVSDLVLPATCAGCGRGGARLRFGACPGCVAAVTGLSPRRTRPDPAPAGLPECAALGGYQGVLRELVLAYKDRGRHRLADPLGRLLAGVVAELLPAPVPASVPVVLVPVPDTPAAARARHGDHLWRLARPAAARLRASGYRVRLARVLRARPRPDSTGLDTAARLAVAGSALRTRRLPAARARAWVTGVAGARVPAAGVPAARVILLDDVITTGATLAAAAVRLRASGLPVVGAAVLAATARTGRSRSSGGTG